MVNDLYDMSIHSSTDAKEWTDFFFEKHPNCNVDKGTMLGWFANAMMAMHDNASRNLISEHKHNNVGYLYKQKDCYGEIETVFSFDKPYITWHNVADVTPVYTAPPKREPPITSREMYQRGYAAAERDLNREPLSDERLEFLVDKYHGYPKTLGREIEKAHGIGVVE
jgi:hypothetical protein